MAMVKTLEVGDGGGGPGVRRPLMVGWETRVVTRGGKVQARRREDGETLTLLQQAGRSWGVRHEPSQQSVRGQYTATAIRGGPILYLTVYWELGSLH